MYSLCPIVLHISRATSLQYVETFLNYRETHTVGVLWHRKGGGVHGTREKGEGQQFPKLQVEKTNMT
jgi:hypothetical protein